MFGLVSKSKVAELRQAHAYALRDRDALEELHVQRLANLDEKILAAERSYQALVELNQELRAQLEQASAERRLLLDRIVQMSGQPALFTQAPAPPVVLENGLPGPPARVSFDDVHKAARAAIKDGRIKLRGRGN
jgi:hypothetical protein